MTKYQSLEVWKVSMELVKEVYTLTKEYPKEEIYSLTSQTRRSVVSVPSNIAEGVGRQYKKDTLQFLHIARGSLYELETQLNIAVMIGLITNEGMLKTTALLEKALQLLNGYINYIDKANLK